MTELAPAIIVVAIVSTLVGAIGAVIVLVLILHRRSYRQRQLNVTRRRWSRWLAARRTMSRATVSLVAAFRELRREPSGEVSRTWRHEEAQRARTYWHEAVREHERAEADLEIEHWMSHVDTRVVFPRHPASEGFRAAITGSSDEANALILRVQKIDSDATAFARASIQLELAKQSNSFQDPLSRYVVRWGRFMRSLVDSWASG